MFSTLDETQELKALEKMEEEKQRLLKEEREIIERSYYIGLTRGQFARPDDWQ